MAYTVEKVFLGRWPKFLEPLMLFVRDDTRDLVASQKNGHGLSYRRYGASQLSRYVLTLPALPDEGY